MWSLSAATFDSDRNLMCHMRAHTDERPFIYVVCDVTFNQSENVKCSKVYIPPPLPCTLYAWIEKKGWKWQISWRKRIELAEQGRRGPYRKFGSDKLSRQCWTSGLYESASTVQLRTAATSQNRTTGMVDWHTSAPSVTCLQLPGRRTVILYHPSRLSFVVCTPLSTVVLIDRGHHYRMMKSGVFSKWSPDVTVNVHHEDGIVKITVDIGDSVSKDDECEMLTLNNIYIYIYIYIYISIYIYIYVHMHIHKYNYILYIYIYIYIYLDIYFYMYIYISIYIYMYFYRLHVYVHVCV